MVARLDVISVKKLTTVTKHRIKIIRGKSLSIVSLLPIQIASPVSTNPLAKAIPPPNKIITPQGSLTASFHVIRALLLSLDGITNRINPNDIAIIVSSIFGINFCNKNDLEIQHRAVRKNINATLFSSTDILPRLFFNRFISCLPPGNSF